jgi:hypothetical protein
MKLPKRLRDQLAEPRALVWAPLLGTLLMLPALGVGYVMDDFVHLAALDDSAPRILRHAPHELYRFMPDDPRWRETALELGGLPWYIEPDLHGALLRPLAALTIAFDIAAFPGRPALAHLHSLLWFLALALVVARVYARLIPVAWVAALAALLFAVEDAHAHAVAWIANRHALISMTFGAAALLAHIRWRRDRSLVAAALAPASLALGLAAGESALSMTAYLFAFALFLDPGRPLARAASLVPCALVAVAWRVAYDLLGYGTHGMAAYVDPLENPGGYAAALAARLWILLSAQLHGLSADIAAFAPRELLAAFAVVAAVLVAAALLAVGPLVRRDPAARFFLVGGLVAALPLGATMPGDRVLLPVGLGGFGFVAFVIARFSTADVGALWRRRGARALGVLFVVAHLVIAPLLVPLRAWAPALMQESFTSVARSLDRLGPLEGKTVEVLRAPDFAWACLYSGPIRIHEKRPGPARLRLLATGVNALSVSRTGERTLLVEVDGGMMTSPLDDVVRESAFAVGERVELSDLTVTVTAVTADGRPAAFRVDHRAPLDEPGRIFATFAENGYEPFVLPAVGETVRLPALDVVALAKFRHEL